MSEAQKIEAEKLFKKGKSIMGKWVYFGDRYGDSCEYLKRACNKFKMIKEYERAAECLKEMVVAYLKDDSVYEAGSAWLDAGILYEKAEDCFKQAAYCYKKGVECYTEAGKMNRAAKTADQLGDLLSKNEKYEAAIKSFEEAADLYETDNLRTASYDCRKKIAHLYGTVGNYEKAYNEFKEIADYFVNDKVLKWNAKQFYYKAVLIMLCKAGKDLDEEIMNIKDTFEEFKDNDVHLDGTTEADFITAILAAVEDENLKAYSVACKKHERLLDTWVTAILLRVKKNMESTLNDNM